MSGFRRVQLGNCCEIVSGATPDTGTADYWDGDICWATPKDLSSLDGHYISNTPRKLTQLGQSSCSASILPPYSVLFSSRAPIGHVAINTVPMATNQGFKSFVPGPEVDAKFLFHWLRANRSYLEGLGVGATFKEVSKAVVSKVEVPLPPRSEQSRIAAILDKADTLRSKRHEALAQLDRLAQSIFLEMFGDPATNPKGWPTVQLSTLVSAGDSINYGVVQPGDDTEEGVPLVRVGDLQGGCVSHLDLKKIDPQIESAYKRSRLKGDEILVSCVGSIGVVALATEAENGFNIARAVARVRLGDAVERQYMAEHLRSESVQNYFRQELRTVSQPTLNIKQIAATLVMLPPKTLQTEFVRRVSAVKALTTSQLQASKKTANLFASLQKHAFKGAL